MSTPLVVKHLEVIEHLHLRLAAAVESLAELRLHRREEALLRQRVKVLTYRFRQARFPISDHSGADHIERPTKAVRALSLAISR
jgi:hypothetical protein